MSSARGAPSRTQERDFAPKGISYPLISDPGTVGSQDGSLTLVESSSSTADLDLEILVQTYTYDGAAKDDFIILHYTLKNTSASAINGVYAGLYLDWDIGGSPRTNDGDYSTYRNMGYVSDGASKTQKYAGVRLLSTEGNLNYSLLNNSRPPMGPTFTDAEKWGVLSGGVGTTIRASQDVSQFIAAGPINISGNASKEVAFALVTARDTSSLFQNANVAYAEWHGVTITLSASPTSVSEGAGATAITVYGKQQRHHKRCPSVADHGNGFGHIRGGRLCYCGGLQPDAGGQYDDGHGDLHADADG